MYGTTKKECGEMHAVTDRVTTAITGQRGEETAAQYLKGKGYDIQERNTRFGKLELDIVAYDPTEKMIVFVEVKARRQADSRYPLRFAVDARKRRALRRAVARWVNTHQYEGAGRIDIVCVDNGAVSEHIVDLGGEFLR